MMGKDLIQVVKDGKAAEAQTIIAALDLSQVDALDEKGASALHYAASTDSLPIVKSLIEKRCDINLGNQKKNTALHIAAANGYLNVLRLLIENNASVHALNYKNKIALDFAKQKGHINIQNILLRASALQLRTAACGGNGDMVQRIINCNIDVNYPGDKGASVIHYLADQNNLKMLSMLVKRGADVNMKNRKGNTALHIASARGHAQIIAYLLREGADSTLVNDKNQSAIQIATKKKHSKALNAFAKNAKFIWKHWNIEENESKSCISDSRRFHLRKRGWKVQFRNDPKSYQQFQYTWEATGYATASLAEAKRYVTQGNVVDQQAILKVKRKRKRETNGDIPWQEWSASAASSQQTKFRERVSLQQQGWRIQYRVVPSLGRSKFRYSDMKSGKSFHSLARAWNFASIHDATIETSDVTISRANPVLQRHGGNDSTSRWIRWKPELESNLWTGHCNKQDEMIAEKSLRALHSLGWCIEVKKSSQSIRLHPQS